MEVKQKKCANRMEIGMCPAHTHPPPPSLLNNPYFLGGKGPPKTDQRRNSRLAQRTARDDRGQVRARDRRLAPPPRPFQNFSRTKISPRSRPPLAKRKVGRVEMFHLLITKLRCLELETVPCRRPPLAWGENYATSRSSVGKWRRSG